MSADYEIVDYSSLADENLEQMVLNALMLRDDRDRELALIALREKFFINKNHQKIFKTILDLENRGHNATQEIVLSEVKSFDKSIQDSLQSIFSSEVIPDIGYGVETLKKWQEKRAAWIAAMGMLKDLKDGASGRDVFALATREADAVLLDDSSSDTKSFAELEEQYKNEKPVPIWQTGLTFFDQRNKGIWGGQLVAVMGDPDAGKTALVVNMLRNLTAKGHKVMFFPLEFSAKDMVEKTKWRNDFNKELFLLEDRYTDIYDIEAEIKKQALKGVKIFAIDSQMVVTVSGSGWDNSSQREAEKFRVLQRLAIAYELSILFVCQQSNAHSYGGVIMPMGSKHAGHYVHAIWFIKKPKLEFNKDGEEVNKGQREFMQVKAKGAGGYFKANVEIDKKLDFRGIRPKKGFEVEFQDNSGNTVKTLDMPEI